MIYKGISFLNNEQEKCIKEKLFKESLLTNIERYFYFIKLKLHVILI